MLLILFTLVLALLGWVIFKPTWLPKPPENKVTANISNNATKATTATKNAAQKTGNWFTRLKLPFQTRSYLGKELKVWAGQAELNQNILYKSSPETITPAIQWIAGFSDEQASRFAHSLDTFCRSQKMELAWLFDATVGAEMKAALEEIVIFYSLTAWKSNNSQALAAFQNWQAGPYKRENREFTQQLYTRLLAAGLTSTPGELLLASTREQQTHVVKAIQSAAAENHAAVLALVVELYAAEELEKATKAKKAKQEKQQVTLAEPMPQTDHTVTA